MRKTRFRSQADFAGALDMSVRGYQKYEQGETNPTPDMLDKIANALGVTVYDLLRDPSKPHKDPSVSIQALAKTITEQAEEVEKLRQSTRTLTQDEIALLDVFRRLGAVERREIVALARRFLALDNAKTTPARKRG